MSRSVARGLEWSLLVLQGACIGVCVQWRVNRGVTRKPSLFLFQSPRSVWLFFGWALGLGGRAGELSRSGPERDSLKLFECWRIEQGDSISS